MHNTQLLKYIKGIINDDYAMDVLYYCIRRIVADNDFNLHDVTSIRISQKFHKEAVALNINHRFVSRLDALSLVLSVRALMLNHDYLDCCDDDRLLFNPYIEDRYRWLEYYTIINECVVKDEGFAHTFKLLHNVYIEKDISGEDEDVFESFTIMPERRNLRSYYEYKASHGIGGVSEDYISDNAFLCNNDLEEYKINKSIEYVGNTAFAYCPKLNILKIRGRNVIFGKFPIIECPSLESIIVPDGTSGYYTGILSYYQDIIIEESQTLSTFANSGHSTNESNDVVE